MSGWRLNLEIKRIPRGAWEVTQDVLVVGRGQECDLEVPDPRVSREHCRIERRDGGLWLVDLGSRRGTRVNGRSTSAPTPLAAGDVIELSEESRLVVREVGTEAPSGTIYRDAASMLEQHRDPSAATSGEELRRYAERAHLLNEVHRALTESPSRDALLELILDRVFRLLAPEQAAVLLLGTDGELAHAVTRPPRLADGELFFSRSLVHEVTTRRVAALVLDAGADARFAAAASILEQGVKSVLAAPLLVPGGALGVIVLSSRLTVRQFSEADLELLVSLASAAALHLRNLALVEEAAERRRLAGELALARHIQLALLPSRLPEVVGYELLGGNIPSRGVSGDLYTAVWQEETSSLCCYVADVSGKGMAASLLGASLEALAAGPIEVGHTPEELCARVSRRLFARTPPEKYATAFVARLDAKRHQLRWSNAGHNPALLVRDNGAVERCAATGPPLGLLATAAYRAEQTELAPGDLLLVYTDGITEAAAPDDEEFGLERLESCARRYARAPLSELRAALEQSLDEFVRGVPFADDRTLLLLRRTGP